MCSWSGVQQVGRAVLSVAGLLQVGHGLWWRYAASRSWQMERVGILAVAVQVGVVGSVPGLFLKNLAVSVFILQFCQALLTCTRLPTSYS